MAVRVEYTTPTVYAWSYLPGIAPGYLSLAPSATGLATIVANSASVFRLNQPTAGESCTTIPCLQLPWGFVTRSQLT